LCCQFLIGRLRLLLCSAVRAEVSRFIGELYPAVRTEVSRFKVSKLYAAIRTEVSRFIGKLYPAVGAKPLFFGMPSGSSTLLSYPLALLF
jgi:hypothetical protein